MSIDWYKDMVDFEIEVMGAKHPTYPIFPKEDVKELRKAIIMEEINETFAAMDDCDMVEVADGIVDAIVLLIGTAVVYGLDIRPVWDEVYKTNMAKKDGPMRADGKKLKPVDWQPPRVRELLEEQGYIEC